MHDDNRTLLDKYRQRIADKKKVNSTKESLRAPSGESASAPTSGGDAWLAEHPWHPRLLPLAAYCAMLAVVGYVCEASPAAYPLVYGVQLGVCAWLVWRCRTFIPELTVRFHWLAVPVGLGVAFAWIAIGRMMPAVDAEPSVFEQMPEALRWPSLIMRLVGMSILVPLVEEPFVRSMALRSMRRAKPTGWAMVSFICDLPIIGDALMSTNLAKRAHAQGPVMADEFHRNELGALSVFGVFISTLLFMSYHLPRDWPAAIVCSLAYCALLAATARKGLGPVVWAHGITNAALWCYVIATNDWRFM